MNGSNMLYQDTFVHKAEVTTSTFMRFLSFMNRCNMFLQIEFKRGAEATNSALVLCLSVMNRLCPGPHCICALPAWIRLNWHTFAFLGLVVAIPELAFVAEVG